MKITPRVNVVYRDTLLIAGQTYSQYTDKEDFLKLEQTILSTNGYIKSVFTIEDDIKKIDIVKVEPIKVEKKVEIKKEISKKK